MTGNVRKFRFASALALLFSVPTINAFVPVTSTTPTTISYFCRRGGETDIHKDGWGLSFYQEGGIRHFHDLQAACSSPLAGFLTQQLQTDPSVRTPNLMGHIRYATQGEVNLANVHPFCREMWGIPFCFCHNGEVPKFTLEQGDSGRPVLPQLKALWSDEDYQNPPATFYYPIGTTDSEATFCAILNALRGKFQTLPSLPILYEAIQQLCQEIVSEDPKGTILNFLMTCGPHTQWVYSWPGKRPGSKVWNGLHYTTRRGATLKDTSKVESEKPVHLHMVDEGYTVDFDVSSRQFSSHPTTAEDCVSVIATKPLTEDEDWTELGQGELVVFDRGEPSKTPYELFQIELLGHGLQSDVLAKSPLEEDMKQYDLELANFQAMNI